jgi:hypothetical protein
MDRNHGHRIEAEAERNEKSLIKFSRHFRSTVRQVVDCEPLLLRTALRIKLTNGVFSTSGSLFLTNNHITHGTNVISDLWSSFSPLLRHR